MATMYSVLTEGIVSDTGVSYSTADRLGRKQRALGLNVMVRRATQADLVAYERALEHKNAVLDGSFSVQKDAQNKASDASVWRWKMRRHLEDCTLVVLSRGTYNVTALNFDTHDKFTVLDGDLPTFIQLCEQNGVVVKEDWTMAVSPATNGNHYGA